MLGVTGSSQRPQCLIPSCRWTAQRKRHFLRDGLVNNGRPYFLGNSEKGFVILSIILITIAVPNKLFSL